MALPAITWPLNQKAVWWKQKSFTSTGKRTYDTPVEINCRWDSEGVLYLARNGEQKVSNSEVLVDRVLSEGDLLWQGELASLPNNDPDTPFETNTNVFVIEKFNVTPDIPAKEALYEAIL